MTQLSKQVADLILKAANLRENSWDEEEFQKASNHDRRHKDFYGVALETACQMACDKDPNLSFLVFVLLKNSWNESIEWAKAQA